MLKKKVTELYNVDPHENLTRDDLRKLKDLVDEEIDIGVELCTDEPILQEVDSYHSAYEMHYKNIEKRVKEIIAEQLGPRLDQIKSDAQFIKDLRADSLDIVDIIVQCEDEFELEIPDTLVENIVTVEDLVKCVEEKTW